MMRGNKSQKAVAHAQRALQLFVENQLTFKNYVNQKENRNFRFIA